MTTALKDVGKAHIPTQTTAISKPKLPPQYPPIIKRSRPLYKEYIRTGNLEALRYHSQLQRMTTNYLKTYKQRSRIKACTH